MGRTSNVKRNIVRPHRTFASSAFGAPILLALISPLQGGSALALILSGKTKRHSSRYRDRITGRGIETEAANFQGLAATFVLTRVDAVIKFKALAIGEQQTNNGACYMRGPQMQKAGSQPPAFCICGDWCKVE